MSLRAMTWVWDQQVPPNAKIVLLALADHAHDDGSNAYPSIALLARKTGYGERQIQRVLSELVRNGVIAVQHEATFRRPTVYVLAMEEMHVLDRGTFAPRGATPELRKALISRDRMICRYCGKPGDEVVGPDGNAWEADRIEAGDLYSLASCALSCRTCNRQKGRGDKMTPLPEGATPETSGGDTGDVPGATPVTSEPSDNHPEPAGPPVQRTTDGNLTAIEGGRKTSRPRLGEAERKAADAILKPWWEAQDPRPLGNFVVARKAVAQAIAAGHSVQAVQRALTHSFEQGWIITEGTLQRSLRAPHPAGKGRRTPTDDADGYDTSRY